MTRWQREAPDLSPSIDHLPIAVRAYVPLADAEPPRKWHPPPQPSEWVLVFDTETTTDPSQRLRFGSFQWRRDGDLVRSGFFYDPAALTKGEVRTLQRFARVHRLELMMVETFIELSMRCPDRSVCAGYPIITVPVCMT